MGCMATPKVDSPPPSRKSWLRFSLASLFLLTALIGVTTAYILQRSELRRKDEVIRKYRIDLGLLDDRPDVLVVDDPSRAHVAALPSWEPLRWRWRIYVPPDTQWTLQVRHGEVDGDEIRGSGAGTDLQISGEFTLEAAVQRDLDGQVQFVARCGSQGLFAGILDERMIKALINRNQATRKLTGSPKQESFAPQGSIPLLTWKGLAPTKSSAADSAASTPQEMGISLSLEEGSLLPGKGKRKGVTKAAPTKSDDGNLRD